MRSRKNIFVATLFCLALGILFHYFGYERIEIKGVRAHEGIVVIAFTQKHLWGLMKESRQFKDITYVALVVSGSSVDRPNEDSLNSEPILYVMTEEGMVVLFETARHVAYQLKSDIKVRIKRLLHIDEVGEFEKVIDLSNDLAWVGMPFLLLGVMGIMGLLGFLLCFRS